MTDDRKFNCFTPRPPSPGVNATIAASAPSPQSVAVVATFPSSAAPSAGSPTVVASSDAAAVTNSNPILLPFPPKVSVNCGAASLAAPLSSSFDPGPAGFDFSDISELPLHNMGRA